MPPTTSQQQIAHLESALRESRANEAALSARLSALSWLVRYQQNLADDLGRRLVSAMPASEKPPRAKAAASAEAHLEAALASLAACE